LIFQPEAVIKESDLNRSLKSELHVRPIHPPSAMQAFPQRTAVVSSAAGSMEMSAALRILKISNRSFRHDREVSREKGCSM